jgi:hypothetical protein
MTTSDVDQNPVGGPMPTRGNNSTISGSPANHVYGGTDSINAGISLDEARGSVNLDAAPRVRKPHPRGSGHDRNSDTQRLAQDENLLDKAVEDTFPASDAPSHSPVADGSRGSAPKGEDPSGLPSNFKDDKAAQFEYGRQSQASTQHFDTSTDRLRRGNPDIGEVDLGTIQADKPAQVDDYDLFDSSDDSDRVDPTLNH